MARDAVDPLIFSREDEANGARILTKDQNGVVRYKRRGRTTVGMRGKDNILMAQMKADMAALWANGDKYDDIAERISDRYNLDGDQRITSYTIHYHIKSMLEYWRQKGRALIDERQAIILARFDQLEALALEAYFESKQGQTTKSRERQIDRIRDKDQVSSALEREREGRDGNKRKKELFIETGDLSDNDIYLELHQRVKKTTRTTDNHPGDVKFLNLIFSINRERGKILGLYNRKDQPDGDREAAKLSDEQRQDKLLTLISAARDRHEKKASMLADPSPLGGFPEEKGVPDIPMEDLDDSIEVPAEIEWDDSEVDEVDWDD